MLQRLRAPSVVSFLVVAGVVAFVVWQLHPSLLLANTTTAGGDTGAHVALPAYLEHHLLPHFRLTGWSPQWYDGYPELTFYFPLPSLIVVLLNLVLPYNIAFKLVTAAGTIAMPVCAWAFGKLSRMPRPGPELLAVATLPFLFDRSYTIYGGNIASTLAGEYAFSLALAIGLVCLGVVARGLETGRHRALAAVLLGLTALCHLVPALFVAAGAVILTLMRLDRRRLRWALATGAAGAAITGFWSIPFLVRLPYTTDMGWQKITAYVSTLFPSGDRWAIALAGVGVLISLVRRRRMGTFLGVMAGLSAAAFILAPQGKLYNARFLPFWFLTVYLLAGVAVAELGLLVGDGVARLKERRLEADDLGEAVLAALAGVGERAVEKLAGQPELAGAVRSARAALARDRAELLSDPSEWGAAEREAVKVALEAAPELRTAYELKEALVTACAQGALVPEAMQLWAALAVGSGIAPFARIGRKVAVWGPELAEHVAAGRDPRGFTLARPRAVLATPVAAAIAAISFVSVPLGLSWMPIKVPASFLPDWIRWNYTGYQGKASWPEYHALISTMASIGRRYGCGRAMWEYGPELNQLGTPMALMLLPYWTNDCIDSMEGLLFESSATTPYHFINQSELSLHPSDAMVGLPYSGLDVSLGVRHLQLLGVRYYMAFTPQAESQAAADPSLSLLTRSGPWPVTTSSGQVVERTWDIYLVHDSAQVAPLSYQPVVMTGVAKGGKSWLDAALDWYEDPSRWDVMYAAAGPANWARVPASDVTPPLVPVRSTRISHIRTGSDTISFDVSRTGSPVLVKTSYFPNWRAHGANGPWRVAPNLMVVVPTSHHVSMYYSYTPVDDIGWAVTLAGLAAAAWMAWKGPLPMPPGRVPWRRSRREPSEEPEPGGDEEDASPELVPVGEDSA